MKSPNWTVWMHDRKECKFWLDQYIKKKIIRKSTDDFRLYLRKSDHNLNFAGWVFEQQNELKSIFNETFYDWVINIYYYAIYHSAMSLMSKEGFTSKSHSATLCYLIYYHHGNKLNDSDVHLIARSLATEDIEVIGFSKELRERASYGVHESFEKNLTLQIQEQAREFTNKIKLLLE